MNVQANSSHKLTEALLAAGLHNLTRNENCENNQEPSTSFALSSNRDSSDTCSNSPQSEQSEIEDTPASSAMGNDDKNDFSGIWETSEQRMNTLAPVSQAINITKQNTFLLVKLSDYMTL